MRRILVTRSLFTLATVILVVVLMVVGLALAQNIITRDQPAALTVSGQLSVDETLVLYLDTGGKPDLDSPMGSGDILSFGNVSLAAFGGISGGPPRIPLYVRNNAGTEIRLVVEQSGDKDASPFIEALLGPRDGDVKPSTGNATRIEVGEIFTADLAMHFTQAPGIGNYSFVINFNAEAVIRPPRVRDFLIVDHNRDKTHFAGHSTTAVSDSGFASMSLNSLDENAVVYIEPAWGNYNNLRANMNNLSQYV